LRYVALFHLLSHACLRTLQFVRAPTLLQDYHTLENAIGERLPRAGPFWNRFATGPVHAWLYRLGLERGYFDTTLVDYLVVPIARTFRWFDALEARWTDFLSGEASRESDQVQPHFGSIEEIT
jgi:NAD(P)H-quinone oxidoreductase subunit 5